MNALRNKLTGNSGASILIAMVFFLLCMTVGGVILTAATASAGRLASQRQTQQDYLTVASAATLVRGELEGLSFKLVEKNGAVTSSGLTTSGGGLLAALVEQGAKEILEEGGDSFTAQADIQGPEMQEVACALEMDGACALTLTLEIREEGAGQGRSPIVLTLPAAVNTRTTRHVKTDDAGEKTVTITKTTTAQWGQGGMAKGDGT